MGWFFVGKGAYPYPGAFSDLQMRTGISKLQETSPKKSIFLLITNEIQFDVSLNCSYNIYVVDVHDL